MESIQDLLPLALESYRAGAQSTPRSSTAASGVEFDQQLDVALSNRLPLDEQLLVRFVAAVRSRGLTAARNNRLIEAQQALDEGRRVLASELLSAQGKLIVETFHEAVEAYVEYKRGLIPLARARVRKALAIDCTLISQYGYDILDLHRVQLGHNLMRLDIHQGNLAAAAELCASLISYLEGRAGEWPLPEFKIETDPAQLPAELRSAMLIQILGELALCLRNKNAAEAARVFTPLLPHVESATAFPCSQHARAHRWLQAKWACVNEEPVAFLRHVTELLREGPGQMLLLWRAAVLDLFDLCCTLDGVEAGQIRAEVFTDSQAWINVPRQFKSRVEFASAA